MALCLESAITIGLANHDQHHDNLDRGRPNEQRQAGGPFAAPHAPRQLDLDSSLTHPTLRHVVLDSDTFRVKAIASSLPSLARLALGSGDSWKHVRTSAQSLRSRS